MVLQYESTAARPQLSREDERRNFNADFVLTYRVNPWTALFAGYNGNRRNVELVTGPGGMRELRPTRGLTSNDAN